MAVLGLVNKFIPTTNIDAYQIPGDGTLLSIAENISAITSVLDPIQTFYYSTNNIVATLLADDGSTNNPDMTVNGVGVGFAIWKRSNEPIDLISPGSNFFITPVTFDTISNGPYNIEFKISDSSLADIRNNFIAAGIDMPAYGILKFDLNYPDVAQVSYAIKYTNAMVLVPVVPSPTPIAVDNTVTTPGVTSESLFIPEVTGSFTYNFYEIGEDDEDLVKRRDFSGENINDIPKFVNLSWDKTPVLPPLTGSPASPRVGGIVIPGAATTPHPATIGDAAAASLAGRFHIALGGTGGAAATSSTGSFHYTYLGVPTPSSIPASILLGIQNTGYVGYVILKEKLDQETGDFVPFDVIVVNSPNQTQLYDWQVAYGQIYRYKIKSLFKYVNRDGIPIYDDTNASLTRQQELNIFGNTAINSYLYFFDSEISLPTIVECIDNRRPDAPHKIMLFPDSREQKITISWNQKNALIDVAGFNVYKKPLNSDKIFQKLNQDLLGIRHNFYEDYDVEIDQEYIYAVEAVDLHGNFSTLSTQMIAKITTFDIDLGRNEEKPRFYDYFGKELRDPPTSQVNKFTYFKNKLKIKVNPLFGPETDGKKFILRILSLDTLITKEIKMKFKLTTINRGRIGPIRVAPIEAPVESGASALIGMHPLPVIGGFTGR